MKMALAVLLVSITGAYAQSVVYGGDTGSATLPPATASTQLVLANTSGVGSVLTEQNSQINVAVNRGIDNAGSTDVSTALGAITTSACALATPPPIYLPAGTYKINSGWLIGATSTTCGYLSIVGAGTATILQTTCAGNSYGIWYNNTTNSGDNFKGLRIEHLQIQDTSGTGACQDGILLTQAARVIINDVKISGFKGQTYATGTVTTVAAAITGIGTTLTAAMNHGVLMTTTGTATSRAELCAVGGATAATLCSNAFPTGNLVGASYAIGYGGRAITCDPGFSFSQYISIHDVYLDGNMYGFFAMGSNSGSNGCSRVTIDGSATLIANTPGSRVTNSIGGWLGRQSDTVKTNAAINNVGVCWAMDSSHAWQIGGDCEDNATYAPITTCNGGVATQNCTAGATVGSDANGSGWNGTFLNFYAYKVGTVYQYDNATGAFNTQIIGDRSISGLYTTHYSFSGVTGCPGNASGITAIIMAYDCNHQLVAQTVN